MHVALLLLVVFPTRLSPPSTSPLSQQLIHCIPFLCGELPDKTELIWPRAQKCPTQANRNT